MMFTVLSVKAELWYLNFGGYPSTQLPQRAPAVYMNPVDSLYNLYNLD